MFSGVQIPYREFFLLNSLYRSVDMFLFMITIIDSLHQTYKIKSKANIQEKFKRNHNMTNVCFLDDKSQMYQFFVFFSNYFKSRNEFSDKIESKEKKKKVKKISTYHLLALIMQAKVLRNYLPCILPSTKGLCFLSAAVKSPCKSRTTQSQHQSDRR